MGVIRVDEDEARAGSTGITGGAGDEPGLLPADRGELAERMAQIVHDLRGPLATTSQVIELLARSGDGPPSEELLDVARRQLETGLRRVDQLMLLLSSDAVGPTLEPEPHRVTDLLEELTAEHRLPGAPGEVVLDADEDLWVEVDAAAFAHVIENLLGNALAHAPADTRVTVSAEEAAGEVLLRIVDDGPGFDADVAERAFEPFIRGPGGGAGLGLTIVRHVVEAHGGRVYIEVDPDRAGTCLVVALPRGDAPA